MQFLVDLTVFILSTYLALVNGLAGQIEAWLPAPSAAVEPTPIGEPAASPLTRVPSEYTDQAAIPDILRHNAQYQSAAVYETGFGTQKNDTAIEDALVNIYCTFTTDEYVRTNTGTGFFIDPAGVIMTNAHVAQFLLLETVNEAGESECIVRAGNPATPQYKAELLYISPAWIQKHAHLIDAVAPTGTGERDYALLYVTAGLNNKPMPGRFPYLSLNTELLTTALQNSAVTVAGYPVTGSALQNPESSALYPVVAETTVVDMYTFGSNFADLIALSDSPVGASGASGGPVLNDSGEVIGLISTRGSDAEGSTSLRAITLSYIDRAIITESTYNLKRTTSGALEVRARLFTETIAGFLTRLLEAELES